MPNYWVATTKRLYDCEMCGSIECTEDEPVCSRCIAENTCPHCSAFCAGVYDIEYQDENGHTWLGIACNVCQKEI